MIHKLQTAMPIQG